MPSGARKRKAAKRRKEQEQQQQLGAHPPGSPTSPSSGPSTPQGNGPREGDDRMSHDGKGGESGSDIASPTAEGNRQHHHHHLEIEGEEQADVGVGARSEDNRKESDTPRLVDIKSVDGIVNGSEENSTESLPPQSVEETAKNAGKVVDVAAVDVREDEIVPVSPLNPVLHNSVNVPISEPEVLSVEHFRSEQDKDVSVAVEVPSPMEYKQSDALETVDLIEQPVHIPVSEEVVETTNVTVECPEIVDDVAGAPSNENEEKLVPLTDAASQELDPTAESHPATGSCATAGCSEGVRSAHLKQRASWLSCCGLFDVITGANR